MNERRPAEAAGDSWRKWPRPMWQLEIDAAEREEARAFALLFWLLMIVLGALVAELTGAR